MQEIHSFKNFSVSMSIGGDYYIENDYGDNILILSPGGSDAHKALAKWIESPDRIAPDFAQNMLDYAEEENAMQITTGVWLHSADSLQVDQKGWGDYDQSKDLDLTLAPYWLTTNSGETLPIHDAEELASWVE